MEAARVEYMSLAYRPPFSKVWGTYKSIPGEFELFFPPSFSTTQELDWLLEKKILLVRPLGKSIYVKDKRFIDGERLRPTIHYAVITEEMHNTAWSDFAI